MSSINSTKLKYKETHEKKRHKETPKQASLQHVFSRTDMELGAHDEQHRSPQLINRQTDQSLS